MLWIRRVARSWIARCEMMDHTPTLMQKLNRYSISIVLISIAFGVRNEEENIRGLLRYWIHGWIVVVCLLLSCITLLKMLTNLRQGFQLILLERQNDRFVVGSR